MNKDGEDPAELLITSVVTKLLVKAGANVEAKTCARSTACTPLHAAAEQGDVETLKVLIEAEANPNNRCK